jgi:hypothetical protein
MSREALKAVPKKAVSFMLFIPPIQDREFARLHRCRPNFFDASAENPRPTTTPKPNCENSLLRPTLPFAIPRRNASSCRAPKEHLRTMAERAPLPPPPAPPTVGAHMPERTHDPARERIPSPAVAVQEAQMSFVLGRPAGILVISGSCWAILCSLRNLLVCSLYHTYK